jgi:hypothetical protein
MSGMQRYRLSQGNAASQPGRKIYPARCEKCGGVVRDRGRQHDNALTSQEFLGMPT